MPTKPLKPCNYPRCSALTAGAWCARHQPDKPERVYRWQYLYNTERWKTRRLVFLAAHRLCVDCGSAANVVDHDVPHKGNVVLFFNERNWVARCKPCHDRKTASQDGGFGHRVKNA